MNSLYACQLKGDLRFPVNGLLASISCHQLKAVYPPTPMYDWSGSEFNLDTAKFGIRRGCGIDNNKLPERGRLFPHRDRRPSTDTISTSTQTIPSTPWPVQGSLSNSGDSRWGFRPQFINTPFFLPLLLQLRELLKPL